MNKTMLEYLEESDQLTEKHWEGFEPLDGVQKDILCSLGAELRRLNDVLPEKRVAFTVALDYIQTQIKIEDLAEV
jgi:hypothetical protein